MQLRRRDRRNGDRRSTENHAFIPERRKRKRRKGERRSGTISLLFGLWAIIPQPPSSQLIIPKTAKTHNVKIETRAGKKLAGAGNQIFIPGRGQPGLFPLWIPYFEHDPKSVCPLDQPERSLVTNLSEVLLEPPPPEEPPEFDYAEIVYPVSRRYGVDWKLIAAIIQAESNFDPAAVSPVGARGLMQLMPATAADYGLGLKDIHDPEANIEAGVKHIKMLIRMYDGDIPLVAAAYNAGQGTVAKYKGIPPYDETRDYVEKVVSYYNSFTG